MDVNEQIDLLETSLKKATINAESAMSHLAYYLPTVKESAQVTRLVDSLLKSSIFFTNSGVKDFHSAYLIIELFYAIFDRKVSISIPTIPANSFYNLVLASVLKCPHKLRQNLVLSGVIACNQKRDQRAILENVSFFKKFDEIALSIITQNSVLVDSNDDSVKALSVLSLALVSDYIDSSKNYNLPNRQIVLFTLPLIYHSAFQSGNVLKFDPSTAQGSFSSLGSNPIIKHLNKLSALIKICLSRSDAQTVKEATTVVSQFIEELHTICLLNYEKFFEKTKNISSYLDILKSIVFSTIMIFQGVVDHALSAPSLSNSFSLLPKFMAKHIYGKPNRSDYYIIAGNCLKALYFSHFIVDSIGIGGFQAYKTVYQTATAIVLQSPQYAEQLSDYFISQSRFTNLVNHAFDRSKLLFILGYWEGLVSVASPAYYDEVINPATTQLIEKPYLTIDFNRVAETRSIIENVHSVKLSSLKLERLAAYNADHVLKYLDIVMFQFPAVLSSRQLVIAVQSLAVVVNSEGIVGQVAPLESQFLAKVYRKAFNEVSNCKLQQPTEEQESYELSTPPPTTKSALTLAFIKTIPYIEVDSLSHWLIKIDSLLSQCSVEEHKFCAQRIWETISQELGISRSNIAIKWWYLRQSKL